jgi:hypothetical protein
VVTTVACGVVDEGKVERIDPQFGLDDTLPTTTVIETTTTQLATTTTGLETTTTQVQTEPVDLYFVASGQLTYVQQPLAAPATLQQIIAALQRSPAGDVGIGLTTIVPDVADIRVTTTDGVAYITLPDGFFDLLSGLSDQRFAIAQLVLTITSSRGIGQVVFNEAVPLPFGQVRAAGQELTFSDYESLTNPNPQVAPDLTVPTATTTSQTTTTTGG